MTGHPIANPDLDDLYAQDAYQDVRDQPPVPPSPTGGSLDADNCGGRPGAHATPGPVDPVPAAEPLDDIDAAASWLADVRTAARILQGATPSAPSLLTVARTRRLAREIDLLAIDGEQEPLQKDPTPGGTT